MRIAEKAMRIGFSRAEAREKDQERKTLYSLTKVVPCYKALGTSYKSSNRRS